MRSLETAQMWNNSGPDGASALKETVRQTVPEVLRKLTWLKNKHLRTLQKSRSSRSSLPCKGTSVWVASLPVPKSCTKTVQVGLDGQLRTSDQSDPLLKGIADVTATPFQGSTTRCDVCPLDMKTIALTDWSPPPLDAC